MIIPRQLLLILLLSVTGSQVLAQLSLSLAVRSPMPAELSVWERDRTLVQLVITNAGNIAYTDARVSFVITDLSSGARVAGSKDTDPSIPTFSIPTGTSVVLAGPDVVSLQGTEVDDRYGSVATSTNSLPEGQFEVCVRILARNGAEIPSTGKSCAVFLVLIPDPPTLIVPEDDVVRSRTTALNFTWTPIVAAPGLRPHYRLVICPVFSHQSGRDAIEQNTPLLDQTFVVSSVFYSPAYPSFDLYPDALRFVWQVQVLDQEGRPAARNEGKSEIFSFRTEQPDTTRSEPAVEIQQPDSTGVQSSTPPSGRRIIRDD